MRAYLRVRTLYVVFVPGKISLTRMYLRHETSSTPDRLLSYCTSPCTGTDNGHNPNSYVFFYVSMYDVTLIWGRFQKLDEDFCRHLRKKTLNREACSRDSPFCFEEGGRKDVARASVTYCTTSTGTSYSVADSLNIAYYIWYSVQLYSVRIC